MKKIILLLSMGTFSLLNAQINTEILHSQTKQKLSTINWAYSTLPTLYNSYAIAYECIKNNIPGDFVECGVAAGAQIAAMSLACKDLKSYRTIHLFDSFEGIPLAGPNDTQQPGIGNITHNTNVDPEKLLISSGISSHSLESVKSRLRQWGTDLTQLKFYKGWFQHTIQPASQHIKQISFLRLDGDLYESTKICLEYLYPKITPGGYIVIDDYALDGCRKAVNEYLAEHNLCPNIITIEGGMGPVFWQILPE